MKIGTKISKVESLLKSKPHLRNDDNMLLVNVWANELQERGVLPKSIKDYNFLALYGLGELSNAESIRRCRQKLQQENPELRGGNYKGRQMAIDDVIEELKNFDKI